MKITVNNKEIILNEPLQNKNMVKVLRGNGFEISAPCYDTKKKHGCCMGCGISVDDKLKYACGTKPHDGMIVVTDTEDLIKMREEKGRAYFAKGEAGGKTACETSSVGKSISGCSCGK